MRWQGSVPGVITYGMVTSASEKGKQHERALRGYSKQRTRNTMISACKEGKPPGQGARRSHLQHPDQRM